MSRKKPEVRKNEIILAALGLAERSSYQTVTRDQIGAKIGISGTAVQYHFKTIGQLRRALMRAAVKRECLTVIAQGLGAGDLTALKASSGLRERAVRVLGGFVVPEEKQPGTDNENDAAKQDLLDSLKPD